MFNNGAKYTEVSKAGWYNTKTWRDLRARKIKESPLCVMCLEEDNICKPAEVVDHIEHITDTSPESWEKFKDYNNLQSLCDAHHRVKTRLENSKYNLLDEGELLMQELEEKLEDD